MDTRSTVYLPKYACENGLLYNTTKVLLGYCRSSKVLNIHANACMLPWMSLRLGHFWNFRGTMFYFCECFSCFFIITVIELHSILRSASIPRGLFLLLIYWCYWLLVWRLFLPTQFGYHQRSPALRHRSMHHRAPHAEAKQRPVPLMFCGVVPLTFQPSWSVLCDHREDVTRESKEARTAASPWHVIVVCFVLRKQMRLTGNDALEN